MLIDQVPRLGGLHVAGEGWRVHTIHVEDEALPNIRAGTLAEIGELVQLLPPVHATSRCFDRGR
jgi:hypothetical protein